MLAVAALTLAALFSGAAIYVLVAEHPARGRIEPPAQLVQWKSSYANGAVMQASLAALSGAAGIALWMRWSDMLFLAGGVEKLNRRIDKRRPLEVSHLKGHRSTGRC